jgi:hypothetical protein
MTLPTSKPDHALGNGSVGLGPQLPMAAYHAIERWHPDRIGAIALYCSDGRWGEAFDEFCHRHLHIPRYDRWAIPGGPACIAASGEESPLVHATRLQLDFLVQAHDLERLVLITHYGCAWYGQRLQRTPDDCLPMQAKDVQTAATVLHAWYPNLHIDAYLAMRQHGWVTFHQLDLGNAIGPADAVSVAGNARV